MKRLASIATFGFAATVLTAIGCGGDGGSNGSISEARAGASGAAEGAAGAAATEGGAAGRSEVETSGVKSQACETGRERCHCFNNGTCYGSLSCLSDFCVDTGAGDAGGSAGTTAGDDARDGSSAGRSAHAGGASRPAGGSNAAGGGAQAGRGGVPGPSEPAAGEGPGGAAGLTAAGSGGQPSGAAGTAGNTDQGGSAAMEGGGGGAGPAGTAGSASGSCLELMTSEQEFTQAISGLTVVTEDFFRDADGAAITDFAVAYGDHFYHHDEVTFESFATSDQQPAGTRSDCVVTERGDGITSAIYAYNGYDGIAMLFTAAQVAVGFSVSAVSGTEGFSLSVLDADGSVVERLALPASGPYFAAVRSTCGATIDSLEVAPNPSETGYHHSQYWALAWVKYAH